MGMAASQARLLALTSRMHDVELRAQYLESQKLALATENDEAYQRYCAAMEATKIQIGCNNGLGLTYVDACFNTLCGYHNPCEEGRNRQYSLVNNLTGKVIVDQETKDIYDQFGQDKYTFALEMLGFGDNFDWDQGGPFVNISNNPNGSSACNVGIGEDSAQIVCNIDSNYSVQGDDGSSYDAGTYPPGVGSDLYMSEVEYIVFLDSIAHGDEELKQKYEELHSASQNNKPVNERKKLLNDFRDCLYRKYSEQIFNLMNIAKDGQQFGSYSEGTYYDANGNIVTPNPDERRQWNNGNREFSYYLELWEHIQQAGGCEVMDPQYAGGQEGEDWLNNMISAGLVSIYELCPPNQYDPDDEVGFSLTTIATSYGNNYLQEVKDEDKAKKAEVEYEHEQDVINRKETKIDNQLKKLETEEKAYETELDSLKKVKDENIDRTFNLFS